jgi:hypothetical protein
MDNRYIIFMVSTRLTNDRSDIALVKAIDREEAKRLAFPYLGQHADNYEVTPLTRPNDLVTVDIPNKIN